jgi:1-acyl-sn-glycerol-3-phosphate acyltransferase
VVRRLLRGLLGVVLRVFFRRLEVDGSEHFPPNGPLMLVPNHPSGLVDPAVVLCLSPRPVSFLAKEPLFRMPVLGAIVRALDSLPVYRHQDEGADPARNSQTFAAARALLSRGGTICIFPEGTSHSDPGLRPLKTGAARIALGAVSGGEGVSEPLRIVPAGLHYTAKGTFRSAALLCFGSPIAVEPVTLDEAGAPPRAAVQELTTRISQALGEVTLSADRVEALALVERAERLLFAQDDDTLPGSFDRERRLLRGYHKLRQHDPHRLDQIVEQLRRYEAELAAAGVDPTRLSEQAIRPAALLGPLLRNLGVAVLGAPLALVGMILHLPAYRLAGYLATRVSHGETDLVATIKVLAAMLLFPLTWLVCALGFGLRLGAGAGGAALVLAPFAGYVALTVVEQLDSLYGGLRGLALVLFRRRAVERLRAEREGLRDQIVAIGEALGEVD